MRAANIDRIYQHIRTYGIDYLLIGIAISLTIIIGYRILAPLPWNGPTGAFIH